LRPLLVIRLALLILSAFTLPSGAAVAQSQSTITASPLPPDVELDSLLSARNWSQLGSVLLRPYPVTEFARKLSWLKTRIDSGGGFFLPLLYARDLWTVGDSAKIADLAKDPRVTAGLMSLYAFELIVIDGAKCEDRSAPDNRVSQLLTQRAAALNFLRLQPPDIKAKIVDIAIALERKTAPLRKDDDLVCRNGLAEMKAGLERGTQQEAPNTGGYVGKRIAVTPPPGWSPNFLSRDVYGPMQDKARADMRGNLLRLVGQPS
jgi:hypothetical protein